MSKVTQRDKIWAILRAENRYIGTYDILNIAHSLSDERINRINIEPIRRCLQELLVKRMVKKDARNLDCPLWLGVPL